MLKSKLYKQITSPEEIYKAIYSLESYIFEKHLLSESDYKDYLQLQDKFNEVFIDSFTNKCIKRIQNVINSDELFDCFIFFRPKKYNKEAKKVEFRPLHSASLVDQVCMVVFLSVLMFDDTSGKRKLSAISRLLPANFYGNIPSLKVNEIFKPWNKQYKDYSTDILEANRRFIDNKKFKYELTLDLEKFFPSINPGFIYNYILAKWYVNASKGDIECLKIILIKLLYFNTDIPTVLKNYYYPDNLSSNNKLHYNLGIAQGLPQGYFFGNICMSLIASCENKFFKGESFFYVDDSVVYTNTEVTQDILNELVENINNEINRYTEIPKIENENLAWFLQLTKDSYYINIHPIDDKSKSIFNKISPVNSLSLLAAPASTFNNELRTSQDEFEDIGLLRKAKSLLDAVDSLLSKEDNNPAELKRLNRFRKFYRNRVNILEHTQSIDEIIDEDDVDKFISKYGLYENPKSEVFLKMLDNDVFIFESQLKAEQLSTDTDLFNKFMTSINNFEFSCLNVPKSEVIKGSLYFNCVLSSIFNHPVNRNIKYDTLKFSKELESIRHKNNLTNLQKAQSISKLINYYNRIDVK